MNEYKVKLININKSFKTRTQNIIAVKDINIEILGGDFVALVGLSGCGKSTIIRMINDIIKPTSGQIFIDNQEIGNKRISKAIIKKMGFIFQQPNLFPWLTVKQNIELPLRIFGLKGKKWELHTEKLIEMVGLNKYSNLFPLELSGSMRQKAGVIRAMVHDPEILLMDEPFGELDEMTREQLDFELLEIWEKTKKTIIFITHNIEEAILLANKVIVMHTNPGRVISEININLPRPRTLSMITKKEFVDYEIKIMNLLGEIDLDKIK